MKPSHILLQSTAQAQTISHLVCITSSLHHIPKTADDGDDDDDNKPFCLMLNCVDD